MKKLLFMGFLLLGLTAMAGEPFFVTKGNRTLYYERYKAGTTTLTQTTNLEIGTITGTAASGRKVNYGMLLRKANGKELFGGRADLVVGIDPNGDVRMDFAATVTAILRNYFPKAKITSEGDSALLPADMKPGDTLPDAHCTVTVGVIKVDVDVTERTVLRRETITVPAGTFDCIVTREHKVEEASIQHNDTWSDSWYVPGIGYVRHDTYDKKMRLQTSEVLISVTEN